MSPGVVGALIVAIGFGGVAVAVVSSWCEAMREDVDRLTAEVFGPDTDDETHFAAIVAAMPDVARDMAQIVEVEERADGAT